ncbi:B3/4 domain-containing protein [Thermodesulfobacteriota bacterium]
MNQYSYSISDEIFKLFPGYCRGVVLAFDIKNGDSPEELTLLLREAEESLCKKIDRDEIAIHPRIASWRDAYRSFGAKTAKYRSSIEAMIRRVLNGNELPNINTIVDIGNIISLRHLITAGGHAIDLLNGDISLRKATGDETFTAFGTDKTENPHPGEIIFTEGNTVLTRRWSWRQANHTATQKSTTAVEMNIDGLPPVTMNEVEDICNEAIDMIRTYCGGRLKYEILSEENPRIELSL